VSASLPACALTHRTREPIDVGRAREEHAAYTRLLGRLGLTVVALPAADELPDAVFVEDTAVVLDEIAVVTRPGAESRRAETAAVSAALARHRPLAHIAAPGTLDGGDVLRLGRRLHVGRSGRSNDAGITQLRALVGAHGYEVIPVEFTGCLHLKSAVTEVADRLLLVNPAWVEAAAFPGWAALEVDPAEPDAANALRIGAAVVYPSHHAATARRLEGAGVRVLPVPAGEVAKAEGGVTCCSLIVTPAHARPAA
jgi:dimethylargininase